MNFLNIGPGELMAIIVIAVLVIGPKRMFTLAQSIGRIARKLSAISGEFLRTVQLEMAETGEGITGDSADMATEARAAKQETGATLESVKAESLPSMISIQEELKSVGREAQSALQEMTAGLTKAMAGGQEKRAAESDEDEGKDTAAEA